MMKEMYKDYLFNHGILVNDTDKHENVFEVLFTLARRFGIEITEGEELASVEMIRDASRNLGDHVPEPFYRGFPNSVRQMTMERIIFDQLLHYYNTYGCGDFEEPGHSVFESEDFKKIAFKESTEPKQFEIISEEAAIKELRRYFNDLLMATRPLSAEQFLFVYCAIDDYGFKPYGVASKNTAIKLVRLKGDAELAGLILKPLDVLDLVDEINYQKYLNKNIKRLNLKNKDRKFITQVIDVLFANEHYIITHWREFFEKQAKWVGLLHHIHYKAKTDKAKALIDALRSGVNDSVYSEFESCLANGYTEKAIKVLKENKGSTAVLRNFNYILVNCKNDKDVSLLIESIADSNPVAMMQLMMSYSVVNEGLRSFVFNKHGLVKIHNETLEEANRRTTRISPVERRYIQASIRSAIAAHYKNKCHLFDKVYIDPAMKNIALPIEESSSSSGYGVMAKGSRIHVPENKILRLFTYWEKVNDIDLSIIGIDKDGDKRCEFSWRTTRKFLGHGANDPIIFSGDETSGYKGGSEYFDIDIEKFRALYPDTRYLICCNNVYSGITFDEVFCKAGYMLRDHLGSGEIYEPKTVKTSFTINANSMMSYLFAYDVETSDLIWLNIGADSRSRVAGCGEFSFLKRYFNTCDVMNLYDFFSMFAKEVVNHITDADLIVSDDYLVDYKEGAKQIKSYDFEEILRLMNA